MGSGLEIDRTLTAVIVFLSLLGELCGEQACLRCPKTVSVGEKDDDLEDEVEEGKEKSDEYSSSKLVNLLK